MLADLVCLALRDETDIITGDFNQTGGYLEEVVFNAVMYHEKENNLPRGSVKWLIHGKACEIRAVLFNWLVDGIEHDMLVKEQTTFTDLCVEDFGLKPTDEDSHVPQFSW